MSRNRISAREYLFSKIYFSSIRKRLFWSRDVLIYGANLFNCASIRYRVVNGLSADGEMRE